MISTKKPLHPLGENTKHKTQNTKHKTQKSISFIGNDFTGINIKGDVFAMIKRGFKHSFIDLRNQKNTQTPTSIMVSTKKPLHPLGENTKHKTQKTTKSGGFECTIATKGWEVLINGIRQTQCVNGMCSIKALYL
jgi:hypothetical protein